MICDNCGTKVVVGNKCGKGKTYCTKCCDKLCYNIEPKKPYIPLDIT